jgi:hypothetical protein
VGEHVGAGAADQRARGVGLGARLVEQTCAKEHVGADPVDADGGQRVLLRDHRLAAGHPHQRLGLPAEQRQRGADGDAGPELEAGVGAGAGLVAERARGLQRLLEAPGELVDRHAERDAGGDHLAVAGLAGAADAGLDLRHRGVDLPAAEREHRPREVDLAHRAAVAGEAAPERRLRQPLEPEQARQVGDVVVRGRARGELAGRLGAVDREHADREHAQQLGRIVVLGADQAVQVGELGQAPARERVRARS